MQKKQNVKFHQNREVVVFIKQKLNYEDVEYIVHNLDNFEPSFFAEKFKVHKNVIAGIISAYKNGVLWTKFQEEYLIKNHKEQSLKELGENIGKNIPCVCGKLKQLGLKKDDRFMYLKTNPDIGKNTRFKKKEFSTKLIEQIKDLYLNQNLPKEKIEKIIGTTNRTLRRVLKENKIEVRPPNFYTKGKPRNYMKEIMRGEKNPNYQGKLNLKKGYKELLSKVLKEKWNSTQWGIEEKKKRRENMSLNKNPAWCGGKSFEPYTLDFNNSFRAQIRGRDNYCCVICNKHITKKNCRLAVHHIDYNKLNSFPQNCVSLCNSCHIITNLNRAGWKLYFQKILTERYNYEYSQDQKIILDFDKVVKNE